MPGVDNGEVVQGAGGNGAVSPNGLGDDRVAELLATFTRASDDLAVLAGAIDALSANGVEASFATEAMHRRVHRLEAERAGLRGEVKELTGRLEDMRVRLRELEAELAAQRS
jgi:uncharacterized protein involved in exopolysaccharide biosynthesis